MANLFEENLFKPNVIRFAITTKTEPLIGIYLGKDAKVIRIFVSSMIYTHFRGENHAKVQIDLYGVNNSPSDQADNSLASKSAIMPEENRGFFELSTDFNLDGQELQKYAFLGVDLFILAESLRDNSDVYVPILRTIMPIIKVSE